MAIRSMTGYGLGSADRGGLRVTVELRTVNNRFADLRMRLPLELAAHERQVKRKVLGRVRRGRVELALRVERPGDAESGSMLNQPLLEALLEASQRLKQESRLEGNLDLATALSVPGMFRAEAPEVEWDDEQRKLFDEAVDAGLEALDQDRRREGEHLQQELLQRVSAMDALTATIRARAAAQPATLRDRLLERLKSLGEDVQLDPDRVAQEAVLLADRCDVTEEIVRLASHLEQARALLGEPDGEPVGRRLEFLVQEILRETNTVNSKSTDIELTRAALELKSELEKVREQIQNLE